MSSVPKEKRTLDEWLALITEARQSGLTDAEWCRRHDISRHTFGSAIKRLRRKSCAIPQSNSCVDLTSSSSAVPAQNAVMPWIRHPLRPDHRLL